MRASRVVIDHLRDRYPRMVQMIYVCNFPALRWVRALGFEVSKEPERFGTANTLFFKIKMETLKLTLEGHYV